MFFYEITICLDRLGLLQVIKKIYKILVATLQHSNIKFYKNKWGSHSDIESKNS
jgi:hypothetical protein